MFHLLALLPVIVADSFWMTAELLQVDWMEGCLTTAGCSQPRFKILENMLPLSEEISISWPVSENFVQDMSHPFVSHWARGKPEELTLSCQVVGTDPTYGFPRVCDQSASVRVLQDGAIDGFGRSRHQQTNTTALPEEERGTILFEIRAKCFNATIAVQKHIERCPWCPDPLEMTLIEQKEEDSTTVLSWISSQLRDEKILYASIISLAGIAILASLGFAFVLVAFLRQKSTHRQILVNLPHQPYLRSSCKTTKDENKYDLPWEQNRPITYWQSFSSKSEGSPTTALKSSSSLGTRSSIVTPHAFRSGFIIPQTHLYHRIASNSSEHDSGLGSV